MSIDYLTTRELGFAVELKNGDKLVLGNANYFETNFNYDEVVFKDNNDKNIALFFKEDIISIYKI